MWWLNMLLGNFFFWLNLQHIWTEETPELKDEAHSPTISNENGLSTFIKNLPSRIAPRKVWLAINEMS